MADRWKTGASPKLRMAHGTTVDRRGLVTFTVKLPPKVEATQNKAGRSHFDAKSRWLYMKPL